MPTELVVLGLGAVLLLVHVLLAGHYRTRQYGTVWNMGARDEAMPPLDPVPARLLRVQANYLETFPVSSGPNTDGDQRAGHHAGDHTARAGVLRMAQKAPQAKAHDRTLACRTLEKLKVRFPLSIQAVAATHAERPLWSAFLRIGLLGPRVR